MWSGRRLEGQDVRHLHCAWATTTRPQLRTILFDYIETFYERARHQTGLEHHTCRNLRFLTRSRMI